MVNEQNSNGRYVIPGAPQEPTYETQQAAAFSARLDTQQYTPEINYGPYHSLMEIAKRLESYRETAVEIEQSRHGWLKAAKSFVIAPKPILAELIEKESIIGGRLFQKINPTDEPRFVCEGGEWFYWPNGKDTSAVESALHYEVEENTIQKSFHGRVTPLTLGELETFVQATREYEHAVAHELYPFDEVLQELLTKNDLDLAA